MKTSTQSLIVIPIALISVFIFTASYSYVLPRQSTITTCTLNLQISITQGHNINYKISGKIFFGDPDGLGPDWNVKFIKEDGGLPFPVSVYFNGPAIYFILNTVNTKEGRIFGTGIMDSDPNTCTGNGGGTISGPAEDDLGNWRGTWLRETTIIPEENTPTAPDSSDIPQPYTYYNYNRIPWSVIACLGAPFGVLLLFIAIRVGWAMRPYYKTSNSQKHKGYNSSLQKVNHKTNAEMDGNKRPVMEYLATYNATDKSFDITFEIEEAAQYLGECGVMIAKTLDAKLTKATALEIWAFDVKNAQTTSRILMSHFCSHEEILRSEMQQKGEALLIQPGEIITMQTEKLKISAKILEIEYMADTTYPRSVFKKVVIQIDVWKQ